MGKNRLECTEFFYLPCNKQPWTLLFLFTTAHHAKKNVIGEQLLLPIFRLLHCQRYCMYGYKLSITIESHKKIISNDKRLYKTSTCFTDKSNIEKETRRQLTCR